MSTPGIQEACLALAEDLMAAELAANGDDVKTSGRVLSLAMAIDQAVDRWYTEHGGEATPLVS